MSVLRKRFHSLIISTSRLIGRKTVSAHPHQNWANELSSVIVLLFFPFETCVWWTFPSSVSCFRKLFSDQASNGECPASERKINLNTLAQTLEVTHFSGSTFEDIGIRITHDSIAEASIKTSVCEIVSEVSYFRFCRFVGVVCRKLADVWWASSSWFWVYPSYWWMHFVWRSVCSPKILTC